MMTNTCNTDILHSWPIYYGSREGSLTSVSTLVKIATEVRNGSLQWMSYSLCALSRGDIDAVVEPLRYTYIATLSLNYDPMQVHHNLGDTRQTESTHIVR